MEPKTPSSNFSPEQLPVSNQPHTERVSNLETPEMRIESGAESYEQKSETNAIMADVGLTTVLPAPIVGTTIVADTNSTTVSTRNPLVASDDDLIEKEWVDKAKKIVAQTQDNPRLRDEEVNKLQVDYLKKRFGREIGASE